MAIIDDGMYGDVEMESTQAEDPSGKKSPTALLPKSITMGKDVEVGDSIVVKVTRIYDDELEVEYARPKSNAPPMQMDDME
jgi:hypothetical protein